MKKTRKLGGKVIASGGFGCIFQPHLLCGKKHKEKRLCFKINVQEIRSKRIQRNSKI